MLTVNAYGATSATEPLVPMTTQRSDPGPHDVLIEIRYCDICHSDITHARSEWRSEPYPAHPRPRVHRRRGRGRLRCLPACRGPAAMRGHHHLLPAAPLGRRPRQEGRGHRPRRTGVWNGQLRV